MTKAIFRKWEPIIDLPNSLFSTRLYDDHEGFRVLLETESDDKFLKISFDEVLSYRSTDEGNLVRIFQESDGLEKWCLYIVSDSDFLENFHYNSCGVHKDKEIIHFAIYTLNDCLDVLSTSEPQVTWLVNSE